MKQWFDGVVYSSEETQSIQTQANARKKEKKKGEGDQMDRPPQARNIVELLLLGCAQLGTMLVVHCIIFHRPQTTGLVLFICPKQRTHHILRLGDTIMTQLPPSAGITVERVESGIVGS